MDRQYRSPPGASANASLEHPVEALVGQLASHRATLDRLASALSRRCAVGGKLDAARLDAEQLACFDVAWAQATLQAAECAIAPDAALDASHLELGCLFAVDALSVLDGQVVALCDALDAAPPSPCREVYAQLRRQFAGPAQREALALWMRANDAALGRWPLDEGLDLMRDQFERFAAQKVAPLADAIHRRKQLVPEDILAPLRQMGLFGLSIPERFGGSADGSHGDLPMIVATEALSEASLGAAGSLITRPEILARALLAGGTPSQQAYWLPRIAAGDPLCAIAITEPDAGSDVAALSLRATPVPGGWQLDGAKTWCTFAGKAGLLMVVARTDPDRRSGARGLSLFLVEKPSEEGEAFTFRQSGGGCLSGRAIPTLGYRGMHSFDLSFEGFFVATDRVVGESGGLGKGFALVMTGMAGGRLQTAARACGVMRAALRAGLRYACERRLFGTALADQPLTRARLVCSAARYVAARRLTYRAAQSDGGAEAAVQASLAKLFACRAAEQVTRDMQQLHGGLGYAEETPVARYFVDARVLSIFEGSEETLALRVIARHLLARALET